MNPGPETKQSDFVPKDFLGDLIVGFPASKPPFPCAQTSLATQQYWADLDHPSVWWYQTQVQQFALRCLWESVSEQLKVRKCL